MEEKYKNSLIIDILLINWLIRDNKNAGLIRMQDTQDS
jgi:hypothetical protein